MDDIRGRAERLTQKIAVFQDNRTNETFHIRQENAFAWLVDVIEEAFRKEHAIVADDIVSRIKI